MSQECVEYASCPVVVVRTERTLGDGDLILAGKDGSPGAQQALEWAHSLAQVTGAGLRAANHLVRHAATNVAVVPTRNGGPT